MKQLIVVIGLIFLGVIIAGMILGDGEGTLFTAGRDMMINHLEAMSD